MTESRVLAVLAHPDDEVFRCGGTLALLAQLGVRVHVLTATRGEAGSCGDPPLCTLDELPTLRERELRCACAALGIEPPRLLDYRDNTLADVDEDEAVGQVLAVVRELRPDVLLTWPPDGLSGHLDHMAISRWTTRAFHRAASPGQDAPAALYHLAVPRSVAQALGLAHLHAIPDENVTVVVDVTPVWPQKMAAIGCHRTQAGESPILQAPEARQRLFLGREHFRRAEARQQHDFFLDLKEKQPAHADYAPGADREADRHPGPGPGPRCPPGQATGGSRARRVQCGCSGRGLWPQWPLQSVV